MEETRLIGNATRVTQAARTHNKWKQTTFINSLLFKEHTTQILERLSDEN